MPMLVDVGFKAKDLSFEAEDFKMCPRGLHLWLYFIKQSAT